MHVRIEDHERAVGEGGGVSIGGGRGAVDVEVGRASGDMRGTGDVVERWHAVEVAQASPGDLEVHVDRSIGRSAIATHPCQVERVVIDFQRTSGDQAGLEVVEAPGPHRRGDRGRPDPLDDRDRGRVHREAEA